MRRKTLAVAALAVVFVALLVSAGVAIASHCENGTDDYNGSCETQDNQVSCGTGDLPSGQPVGATLDPWSLRGEVSVCKDSGPVWQGRVMAAVVEPNKHGGGVGVAHDGDADNAPPLQSWYRVSWFPMEGFPPYLGYVRGDCGARDAWAPGGDACGPQIQTGPAGCGAGEGSNDYNWNCEDGSGQVHCGTGALPRGAWGKIVEPYDIWHQPLGASYYPSYGAGEVSVCNNGSYLGPQGRVWVAFDSRGVGAAYDGDPSNPAPLQGWRRVSVTSGGVESRCGSGDSFWEAGSPC